MIQRYGWLELARLASPVTPHLEQIDSALRRSSEVSPALEVGTYRPILSCEGHRAMYILIRRLRMQADTNFLRSTCGRYTQIFLARVGTAFLSNSKTDKDSTDKCDLPVTKKNLVDRMVQGWLRREARNDGVNLNTRLAPTIAIKSIDAVHHIGRTGRARPYETRRV